MADVGSTESGDGAGEQLARDELRRRATGGAALLAARSGLILVVGVAANLALARLLEPRDFGLVALGTAFLLLGTRLSDGGLAVALIRRTPEPERRQLEAVNGFQVAATSALALIVALIAMVVGGDALVIATIVATIPIVVLRAPSLIVLERRLDYRVIATVDVLEALSFYAFALVSVALGAGVWGVAAAAVLRAVVGTSAMVLRGPVGLLRPRWSWMEVRPLVGFGVKTQSVGVANALREQGLNAGIALMAGISTLGVWSLAWRVLQVVYALLATVGRVLYPTISRVMGAGDDVRPLLERSAATVAVAAGAVIVAIAGFASALPAVVGPEWEDTPGTLVLACVALVVGAPRSVVLSSYLYAAGDAGSVLRAVAVHAVVWLAVALALVDELGAPIVGVGWIAASIAGNAVLARRAAVHTDARVTAALLPPTAAALAAIGAGWIIASPGHPSVLLGVVGAVGGELVLFGCLALMRPALLRDTGALLVEARRSSFGTAAVPAARGA